ncbi:hypothetical protein D3C76_1530520 [compost metagenome]
MGLVDTDLRGNGLSGVRIVAGEHDSLDTQLMQFGNRLAAAVLDGIGHREQGQRAGLVEQQHHGLALTLQSVEFFFELW